MELSVSVNVKEALVGLSDVRTEQVPFALAQSLNATAKQFQRVQLAHMTQVFTLRRPDFAAQAVKITHFATKAEQWATIGIHPPGDQGDARADIFAKFEDQTQKTPFTGHSVAVPTIFIKRNKRDVIPQNLFPSALKLHADGNRVIGDQRTFLVRTKNGTHVILQRIGRGKRSITAALWTFKPSVPITPDLEFEVNAAAVVESGWQINFEAAYEAALATAR